jgi:hypothetical protein
MIPEYLDILRCFEYDEVVNGKQVHYVRIFSPYRARGHYISIRRRVDLEQHPEMLLFEGYTGRHGSIYIADRRVPITGVRGN